MNCREYSTKFESGGWSSFSRMSWVRCILGFRRHDEICFPLHGRIHARPSPSQDKVKWWGFFLMYFVLTSHAHTLRWIMWGLRYENEIHPIPSSLTSHPSLPPSLPPLTFVHLSLSLSHYGRVNIFPIHHIGG